MAKQDRKGAGKGAATASSDTRVETKKALRGFYARVGVILQGIANAPTDQSLDNLEQDMYAVQIDTSTWVLKHMGEAANQKLRSGIRPAMGFPWPGEHSAESQLLRNKMMVTLMDMQTNLEAMMQSDTWDKQ